MMEVAAVVVVCKVTVQ